MIKSSIRVLITESCNSNCINCFNVAYRGDKEIDVDSFKKLSEYLSQNHISRIKIMGGEPTVHSSFEEIISISQFYFKSIVIFTNAINNRILNISPRGEDVIVYNFNFISSCFDMRKFLTGLPGKRRIEVQIGSRTSIDSTIRRLALCKDIPGLMINLTLDCMDNVFEKEGELERKFITVSHYVRDVLGKNYFVDHKIPLCLLGGAFKEPESICSFECAGLIDSSMNLRFCNQYQKTVCSLIGDNGQFIPFDDVLSELFSCFETKIELLKRCKCDNCNYYPNKCNGGCFAHKNISMLKE